MEHLNRIPHHCVLHQLLPSSPYLYRKTVNLQGQRGKSPLHEASRTGSARVVSLLLSHGAKINAKDSRGRQGTTKSRICSTPKNTALSNVITVCVVVLPTWRVRCLALFSNASLTVDTNPLRNALLMVLSRRPARVICGPAPKDSVALRCEFRGREGPSWCRCKS